MPKGFAAVRNASDEIKARKESYSGGGSRLYFTIQDGDSAVVRFLDDGESIAYAWRHKTPPTSDRQYGGWVTCRDQDPETGQSIGAECPGCDRDLKKQVRGYLNVIWRNAPVYARDEKGKLVKDRSGQKVVEDYKDQVALWDTGITVLDELDELDRTYTGLASRDFRIKRRGAKLQTTYSIFPAEPDGGKQALSEEDTELAGNKYDLSDLIDPPSVADYWGGSSKKDGVPSVDAISESSPFRKRS